MVSDRLFEGRRLTASSISVEATPSAVLAEGQALLDGVRVSGRWRKGTTPEERHRSEVRGRIELSPSAVAAFDIGLPEGSVSGVGQGDFRLSLEDGSAPRFLLTSDLSGLGLRIPQIGWSKTAATSGELTVEGRLGRGGQLDTVEMSAAGLTVTGGKVELDADGGFQTASFERVQVGGWLDAPVTLVSRGSNRPLAVRIGGGTYDMRRAAFSADGSGSGNHGRWISPWTG